MDINKKFADDDICNRLFGMTAKLYLRFKIASNFLNLLYKSNSYIEGSFFTIAKLNKNVKIKSIRQVYQRFQRCREVAFRGLS